MTERAAAVGDAVTGLDSPERARDAAVAGAVAAGAVLVRGRSASSSPTTGLDSLAGSVEVPGAAARLALARGLALQGRRVVCVVDDVADAALAAALPRAGAQLLLGGARAGPDRIVAAAGGAVACPTWAEDVAPALTAALQALAVSPDPAPSGVTLLRIHAALPDEVAPRDARPSADGARVLCDGPDGTIVATGRHVPLALRTARTLAGRGVRTRVVQLQVLRGGQGWDVAGLDAGLLVGTGGIRSLAAVDGQGPQRDVASAAAAVLGRGRGGGA